MIGDREVDGIAARTLASRAGEIEAAFVPGAGMVGCSLQHRGDELLGQRAGLAAYIADRSTMGIPFLHPWANRLSRKRFELQGRQVDLESHSLPVSLDPNGLVIHGLLAGASEWRVDRHEAADDGGRLAASFDFGSREELLAAFPFPHRIELKATLAGATLKIETGVVATGEVAVPVSFGYHPYFRLPGVERVAWKVEIPVSERVVLDAEKLPTGRLEATRVPGGPLGSRTFDDEFAAPRGSAPFILAGGGRRIEVSLGPGYPYAQVYAPSDDDVIAFEPMTAPTNALVRQGLELPLVPPGESYEATFSITIAADA
jgi:galactose mutarotase-like enzyme